jgi:hypothetical protein
MGFQDVDGRNERGHEGAKIAPGPGVAFWPRKRPFWPLENPGNALKNGCGSTI